MDNDNYPSMNELAELASEYLTDGFGTEVIEQVTRSLMERQEYHIKAAWRAGYEYVHVYDTSSFVTEPLGREDPLESFHVPMDDYVPSHNAEPSYHPGRYRFTYDLDSVSDYEIKRAIREANE